MEKDLVIIAGRNEEAVGKPLIYTTSKSFMDYFGINTKDDLPKINEVLMEELVQATVINQTNAAEEIEGEGVSALVVDEDGKIVEELDELSIEQNSDGSTATNEGPENKQVKEDETKDES